MANALKLGLKSSVFELCACKASNAQGYTNAVVVAPRLSAKGWSKKELAAWTRVQVTGSMEVHRHVTKHQHFSEPLKGKRRAAVMRAASVEAEAGPQVVVTREQGKNGKLVKALAAHGIKCLELPLIEHREGPDVHRLPQVLKEETWDWIIITSPEAATVFLEGWRAAGRPKVRLSVVGAGTGTVLEEAPEADDLRPEFTPSKATAKVLAVEIPEPQPGSRVLYPASVKAGSDLQEGLEARGFKVTRLNTYSTETVRTVDPNALAAAADAPVATFASPTAVKAWVERVCQGDVKRWSGAAACIGNTSAVAARNAGLDKIYFPDSPGIEGWVRSVREALSAVET
ncbi:uroporphyrinogen III synthase [Klebsormidium nitens]|uniref:Uroporphyrinogen-III synthase n=1 Tax=Klebsormidium nitens TaxID=105231 RepID=A0A1Y1HMK0_KLENI|nr:uroporphyrinogen III synthase [Klebsormidium nitens]|eukprot:GAQ79840.1 uroporphyrinogen III synthase [Klebsormidium nitens]